MRCLESTRPKKIIQQWGALYRILTGATQVLTLVLSVGCASTFQRVSTPNLSKIDQNSAIIRVTRSSSIVGAAIPIQVNDGSLVVGDLGPGGELVWKRHAGHLNLTGTGAGWKLKNNTEISMPVNGGNLYDFSAEMGFGGASFRFQAVRDLTGTSVYDRQGIECSGAEIKSLLGIE